MVSIAVIPCIPFIIFHHHYYDHIRSTHVWLNAVITGYEPQPDLLISPISWANAPCAIWASTCGKWIIGNHQKQFQRSFIESRFLDLLKSKSHVRQCQHKSTSKFSAQVGRHIKFTEEDWRQKAKKGCTSQGKKPKASTSLGAKVKGDECNRRQVYEQCKQLCDQDEKSDACSVIK